jgi:hypothetical protein
MLILGFLTRFAAIFLLGVALNDIVLTELPVLLGAPIGPFTGVNASFYGVWGFLYEGQLDFVLFMASLYLVAAGPDRRSLDAYPFGEEHDPHADPRSDPIPRTLESTRYEPFEPGMFIRSPLSSCPFEVGRVPLRSRRTPRLRSHRRRR